VKRYAFLPALAVIASAACSTATREVPAGNTAVMAADRTADVAALQSGEEIFQAVCTQCHTLEPPAGKAPPMSHVARHYRDNLPDREQAVGRITEWLRGPAEERSLLPAHAIEMWGLMPPLELDSRQIRAVAEFVWTLPDQAADEQMDMGGHEMMMRGGRGMYMGGGQGMMMGGGQGMMMRGEHGMQMGEGHAMEMRHDSMHAATGGQGMQMGDHHGMHMRHDSTHAATGGQAMGMGMGMMHRRGMAPPDTSSSRD